MAAYRHVEQQNSRVNGSDTGNLQYDRMSGQNMAAYRHVEQPKTRVDGSDSGNLQYERMAGHQVAVQQGGQVVNDGEKAADAIKNDHPTGTVKEADEDSGCFKVVRTNKRIEIPCTRNEQRRYKVSVPKTVQERVPRRVQYTDYETREREEPYTVKRYETAYREEEQQYMAQVPKKVTKMVKVTKKVPKTVYVDVVTEEPQESTIMVPETRKRWVKVPFQKQVIDQKYRKVKESVPVTKYRTEFDTVSKTVYEDAWRTKVVPVTKIVRKVIPVYNVVPNGDCGNCDQVDARMVVNANRIDSGRTEQETYQSDVNANAMVQSQPQPLEYTNTNTNPGQRFQANPRYEQPSAAAEVMHQTEALPAPTGAVQPTVAGPAPLQQASSNQIVKRPAEAPMRVSGQAMAYHDAAQWMNQREAAPLTNEPQYDPRMQQMHLAPQQYTTVNNGMRY